MIVRAISSLLHLWRWLFVLGIFFVAAANVCATTYTVTTVTDFPITTVNSANGQIVSGTGAGQVTLRSAVIAANQSGVGPHTINVPAGLGTYSLSQNNPNTPATTATIALPDLEIGANLSTVTVQGTGGTAKVAQTVALNDVITTGFQSNGSSPNIVNLTLDHLEVTGGGFTGIFTGADDGAGHVAVTTITNCNIHDNTNADATFGQGGAIFNQTGSLSISNSTFTNNQATNATRGQGGAIYYDIPNASGQGSTGNLSITNCVFTSNKAAIGSGFPAGGAIFLDIVSSGTAATITGCTFSGNQATGGGDGGAVAYANTARVLNITTSTFSGNQVTNAAGHGGAICAQAGTGSVSFCRFVNNTATTATNGKAIFRSGATFTANDNWWTQNTGPATNDVVGTVTLTTWLRFTHTASPGTINTPTGPAPHATTLTASFLTNSAGTAVSTANLVTIIGLPISFSGASLGTLSGAQTTIQASGTATATFTAGSTGGNGGANATVDGATAMAPVVVDEPPIITSLNNTTFLVGTNGGFNVTATGFPAPTFSKTGTLPSAVNLSSAGVLSGTPAAHTGGTYPITITATNGVPPDSIQSFTLTVNEPPAFTSANNTTFTASVAGTTFQLTSSGFPTTFTFTNTGNSLPSGMSLSSAGLVSGTPAVGTGGTYNLTFKVSNGISPDATQSFTLTVNEAPAVTTQPNAVVKCAGQTATFTSAASGFPAPTIQWQVSTNGGGSFSNLTGETSGTLNVNGVTVGQNGNQYRAVFTNVVTSTPSNAALLTVNALPAIPTITPNPTAVDVNSVGNQASGPAGATTYAWTVSNGTLTSANNIQTITYNASTGGNVHLGLIVTNASGCSANSNLDVPTKPIITSITKPSNVPTITFTTLLGRTYTVERKDDLLAVGWTAVTNASNLAGNGSTLTVPDPDPGAGSLPKRYYHVVILP